MEKKQDYADALELTSELMDKVIGGVTSEDGEDNTGDDDSEPIDLGNFVPGKRNPN